MNTALVSVFLHMLLDTGTGLLATAGIAYGIKAYVIPGTKDKKGKP